MKLIVTVLVLMIAACLVATTKAQSSTIKTTKATTLKTTTPRSAPSTTTRKLTTTRKPNVTTTRIVTTTKPTTNPAVFSFCRDRNSSAATGQIQLNKTSQTDTSSCVFDIVAPPGQQIQISCSVVSFNNYNIKMVLFDAIESDWPRPVLNKTYYSTANTLSVYSDFKGSDEFNCKWNTTPNENTTKFKLCRHGQATSANGTIQPLAGNLSQRRCSFSIVAPPEYQIEFSCSAINLTRYKTVGGTIAVFESSNRLETNQTYFSTAENELFIALNLDKDDWIDCKWTTSRREKKTNFKRDLCRDEKATSAIGTITLTRDVKVPSGGCTFVIEAPPDQRIEITCTAVSSDLTIDGLMEFKDGYVPVEPVINQVYHSDSDNKVLVFSGWSESERFSCKWAILPKENGTNLKLCRDTETRSANGTITPLTVLSEGTNDCSFLIEAPPETQIQISCSAIDIDIESSRFHIVGVLGGAVSNPLLNYNYYSANNNLHLEIDVYSDEWFSCKWTTVPKKNGTTKSLAQLLPGFLRCTETTRVLPHLGRLSSHTIPILHPVPLTKLHSTPGQQLTWNAAEIGVELCTFLTTFTNS
ncbi:hypothetical protein DAPPUDRAFT_252947 [Daphnia pulex]|uniref:CUB domain-containing protein n=1 Tax=Daphnia pulex TaxID=6669 RepID=E9H3V2_DAPPU|nr:hypothetical protein DAPPUDRAFT_252947 [Daphnia pulex]|eukprot:EFX73649.1 hypothetical protein DAPPUDRAFT_252947 [Daphnia pulex]